MLDILRTVQDITIIISLKCSLLSRIILQDGSRIWKQSCKTAINLEKAWQNVWEIQFLNKPLKIGNQFEKVDTLQKLGGTNEYCWLYILFYSYWAVWKLKNFKIAMIVSKSFFNSKCWFQTIKSPVASIMLRIK